MDEGPIKMKVGTHKLGKVHIRLKKGPLRMNVGLIRMKGAHNKVIRAKLERKGPT